LLERRKLLARMFWSAIGAVGAGLVTPLLMYVLGPLLKGDGGQEWVRLGNVDDFQPLQPKSVAVALRLREAWVTEDYSLTAWVVRTADKFVVYDPHCTHLGCAYRWVSESQRFFCPCHDGVYDIDGCVISGPPPRPLDTYRYAVRDGALYATVKPRRGASCRSAKA
jgi:menaquinol-cytochrome c reductase iron-sulfur subunit